MHEALLCISVQRTEGEQELLFAKFAVDHFQKQHVSERCRLFLEHPKKRGFRLTLKVQD